DHCLRPRSLHPVSLHAALPISDQVRACVVDLEEAHPRTDRGDLRDPGDAFHPVPAATAVPTDPVTVGVQLTQLRAGVLGPATGTPSTSVDLEPNPGVLTLLDQVEAVRGIEAVLDLVLVPAQVVRAPTDTGIALADTDIEVVLSRVIADPQRLARVSGTTILRG